MIAAHALSLNATLVTNNTRHFQRVGPETPAGKLDPALGVRRGDGRLSKRLASTTFATVWLSEVIFCEYMATNRRS